MGVARLAAFSPRFRGWANWFSLGVWSLDGGSPTQVRAAIRGNYFVTECVNAQSTMRYSGPCGDRTRSLNPCGPQNCATYEIEPSKPKILHPDCSRCRYCTSRTRLDDTEISGSMLRSSRHRDLKTGNSGIPKIGDIVESPPRDPKTPEKRGRRESEVSHRGKGGRHTARAGQRLPTSQILGCPRSRRIDLGHRGIAT